MRRGGNHATACAASRNLTAQPHKAGLQRSCCLPSLNEERGLILQLRRQRSRLSAEATLSALGNCYRSSTHQK